MTAPKSHHNGEMGEAYVCESSISSQNNLTQAFQLLRKGLSSIGGQQLSQPRHSLSTHNSSYFTATLIRRITRAFDTWVSFTGLITATSAYPGAQRRSRFPPTLFKLLANSIPRGPSPSPPLFSTSFMLSGHPQQTPFAVRRRSLGKVPRSWHCAPVATITRVASGV